MKFVKQADELATSTFHSIEEQSNSGYPKRIADVQYSPFEGFGLINALQAVEQITPGSSSSKK